MSVRKMMDEIRGRGLAKLASQLEAWARPCIRMTNTALRFDSNQIGASKFGGWPDIPTQFDWPKYNGHALVFVAQIRLEDVKQYDLDRLLPMGGIMYFFYDLVSAGYDPLHRGAWQICIGNTGVRGLARAVPPTTLDPGIQCELPPCSLSFRSAISLPDPNSALVASLDLSDDEFEQYVEVVGPPSHQLLGYPRLVQGEMELECQLASNGLYCGDETGYKDPRRSELESGSAEWHLLLQLATDTKAGFNWGDDGIVYYWMRRADLGSMRFDRAWLIQQSG